MSASRLPILGKPCPAYETPSTMASAPAEWIFLIHSFAGFILPTIFEQCVKATNLVFLLSTEFKPQSLTLQ